MARSRRPSTTRPLAVAVVAAVGLLGAAVYLVVLAVDRHGAAARSARAQDEGPRVPAVVRSVRVEEHRQKFGPSYDSLLSVDLARPVGGRTSTVVHVPDRRRDRAGTRVTVALDPRDAGYAELVGTPSRTAFDWILSLVMAVVLALIGGVVSVSAWRGLRRRLMSAATGARGDR